MAKAKDKIDWSENLITQMLFDRHSAHNGWACFPQLRNSTGYVRGERTFDFYAIHTWPSKVTKIAYEIKVSRSDWLHEIGKPHKRRSAMKYSNEFYFVAPTGMIKPEEVPEECGLLEAHPKSFRRKVIAKYRKIDSLDEVFVLSLLRAASNTQEDTHHFKYMGRELTKEDLRDLAREEGHALDKWDIEHKAQKIFEKENAEFIQLVEKQERLIDIGKSVERNLNCRDASARQIDEFLGRAFFTFGSMYPINQTIELLTTVKEMMERFQEKPLEELEKLLPEDDGRRRNRYRG